MSTTEISEQLASSSYSNSRTCTHRAPRSVVAYLTCSLACTTAARARAHWPATARSGRPACTGAYSLCTHHGREGCSSLSGGFALARTLHSPRFSATTGDDAALDLAPLSPGAALSKLGNASTTTLALLFEQEKKNKGPAAPCAATPVSASRGRTIEPYV